MIVNTDTFQALILNKKESEAKYKLTIDNNDIESTKSVKLLGITIDDRLRFDQHISNLCSKAAMQLNALGQLQKYRSSHRRCSVKKGVVRNLAKFTGKHLCQSLRTPPGDCF